MDVRTGRPLKRQKRQTGRWMDWRLRKTDRQAGRHRPRLCNRGRQRDRETDRHRQTEINIPTQTDIIDRYG